VRSNPGSNLTSLLRYCPLFCHMVRASLLTPTPGFLEPSAEGPSPIFPGHLSTPPCFWPPASFCQFHTGALAGASIWRRLGILLFEPPVPHFPPTPCYRSEVSFSFLRIPSSYATIGLFHVCTTGALTLPVPLGPVPPPTNLPLLPCIFYAPLRPATRSPRAFPRIGCM